MDEEFYIFKAQFDAMRTMFLANVIPNMAKGNGGNPDTDRVWLYKFLLWEFERENLSDASWHCSETSHTTPETALIDERRFHLQTLATIACIKGRLEEFQGVEIPPHCLFQDSVRFAKRVIQSATGFSETELIAAIKNLSI